MSNSHIEELRTLWRDRIDSMKYHEPELAAVLIGRNQLKQVEESIVTKKMQPGDPYLGGQFLMGVPFIKVDADDCLKLVYGEIRNAI